MIIRTFKYKTEEEKEKVIDFLSKEAHQIYETRKQEVLKGLENDIQRSIFLDWWSGNNINRQDNKYKNISKHDWTIVDGWIMETICLGMG